MAYTSQDVKVLMKLYSADELRARMRFLVEMRNKGISSDVYQGNQVVFRSRQDLTDEINMYDAALDATTNGTTPTGSARGFMIAPGTGMRRDSDYR